MSLMDTEDDDGFAALLDGLNEDDQEQQQQQQPQDDDKGQDWEAIMQAAEAEAEEDSGHLASSAPATAAAAASAPAAPRSFSSMFTATPVSSSFAASVAAALGTTAGSAAATAASSSQPNAATAASSARPNTAIPRKASAAPFSTQPSSSSGGASSAGTPRRVVEFGVAPAPKPEAPSQFLPAESGDAMRDPISGFKISNRLISSVTLKEKLSGSQLFSLSQASRRAATHRAPAASCGGAPAPGGALGILGNWVVFGVLSQRSLPRTTATGKGKFIVWTLCDLEGVSATVLLFGKAFDAYGLKVQEGAVLALANADDSSQFGNKNASQGAGPARPGSFSATGTPSMCLSLRHAGQVLQLGTAADFGYCKSYRNEPGSHGVVKGMVKCKNVVNLAKGDFCEWHLKGEYKKLMNKRPEINQSRDRQVLPFSVGHAAPTHGLQQQQQHSQRAFGASPSALSHSSAITTSLTLKASQQSQRSKAPLSKQAAAVMAAAEATRRRLLSGAAATGGCKSELRQREGKPSEALVAAGAARWEALSAHSKSTSRFVARVVATQIGALGAPTLSAPDPSMMATVAKLSADKAQELTAVAAAVGRAPPTLPPAIAAAAAAAAKSTTATPAAAAAAATGRPAAASAHTPSATPHPAASSPWTAMAASASSAGKPVTPASASSSSSSATTAASAAAPRSTLASALAGKAAPTPAAASFSYTSKRPMPSRPATAAAAAAPPPSPPSSLLARPAVAAAAPAPTPTLAAKPSPPPSQASARPSTAPSSSTAAAAATAAAPAYGPPAPSATAFIQAFGAPPGSGEDLVPMLGRGWEHPTLSSLKPQRPATLNAGERIAQMRAAAQLEQVARLRAAGALGNPDPNSTAPRSLRPPVLPSNKRKSADSPAEGAAERSFVMNPDGSVTLKHPSRPAGSAHVDPSVPAVSKEELVASAKRARLSAAFGFGGAGGLGTLDSAATERMLSASTGSRHAHLVQESASSVAAQEALFNLMERKEAMAVQLGAITQQTVKAYKCTHEGCSAAPSEWPLAACKLKGHRIEKVDMHKRFFHCAQCKFRLATLAAKLPSHACHKCGGTIWQKDAMVPLKVDSAGREQLQLRSEETWLRSTI